MMSVLSALVEEIEEDFFLRTSSFIRFLLLYFSLNNISIIIYEVSNFWKIFTSGRVKSQSR